MPNYGVYWTCPLPTADWQVTSTVVSQEDWWDEINRRASCLPDNQKAKFSSTAQAWYDAHASWWIDDGD